VQVECNPFLNLIVYTGSLNLRVLFFSSPRFRRGYIWQKIHYIHQNPVKAKFVHREEDYLFSSARNYHGLPSMIDVECITPPVITVGSPGFYKG
jgi:hypothetical protein